MPPPPTFTEAERLIEEGICFDLVEALAFLNYEKEMDKKAAEYTNRELTSGRKFGELFEQISLDDNMEMSQW